MRKKRFLLYLILTLTLVGCETIAGVSKDIGNTARNIREVLHLGRDIDAMSK